MLLGVGWGNAVSSGFYLLCIHEQLEQVDLFSIFANNLSLNSNYFKS